MARRKPDKAVEGERPITADFSAKMLETYAGMILDLADHGAAPGKTGPGWLNLFETTNLTLTKDDRIILLGLPELGDSLKGRLDTAAGGDQGVRITLEELAGMLLALSHRMSEARGREALKVMQVAAKVASCFNDHLSRRAPAGRRKGAAKKAPPTKGQKAVYQLKITLKDVRPPVWRRVQVPDCSLAMLHEIIQVAMGWENYHLYDFVVGGERYTDPRGMDDLDMEDAGKVKLSQVAPKEKAKLRYTYDFGDNWQHEVLVEKVLPPEEGQKYPVCIAGKRACPPEDVGGPWGYMEFAEAIRDPQHERHEEFIEWRGEFDPEVFDPDAVNLELRQFWEGGLRGRG
jgi:hypothetical protein